MQKPLQDDSERALDLVGDIYDAALDPDLWVDVLRQVSDFVGGPSSALFSTDVARQTQRFNYIWVTTPTTRASTWRSMSGSTPW